MALTMPRPWLDPVTGIYYIRRRVPVELVNKIGKIVYKASLGTKDPIKAKRRFVERLAKLESSWANLRAGEAELTERQAHSLAAPIYDEWLTLHGENPSLQLAWHVELYPTLWTEELPPRFAMSAVEFFEFRKEQLRNGTLQEDEAWSYEPGVGLVEDVPADFYFYKSMRLACRAKAGELLQSNGLQVDHWSYWTLVKAVAAAYQRASLEIAREAEGYNIPSRSPVEQSAPQASISAAAAVSSARDKAGLENKGVTKVSITRILEDWWQESKAAGRKLATYQNYGNTVRSFIGFLKHDDASKVTAEDIIAFKDHRLSSPSQRTNKVPSAKTVKDGDLAALKTLFGWAAVNRRVPTNPAQGITIKIAKPRRVRPKGFTDSEARAILSAALDYEPGRERPCTAAAKRWVPWLCAFTGARVGEIGQLRRQDVRLEDERWVININPEAGTVKTDEARDVVVHPQVVELGFIQFVQKSAEGPLFLIPGKDGDVLGPLQGLKNRLAEFSRSIVPDPNVAPMHGWRHRFKTVGMEADIQMRVLDAIQGHAARSVSDRYGEITLGTKAAAIGKFPRIKIG